MHPATFLAIHLASLVLAAGLTPDNTCGGANGYTCDAKKEGGGPCCSLWGFCGSEPIYCNTGNGCQKGFGQCHVAPAVPEVDPPKQHQPMVLEAAEEGRCGKSYGNKICEKDECCSGAGYCGTGQEFCSSPENCQLGYGKCDADKFPDGYNTALDNRHIPADVFKHGEIDHCTEKGTIALTYDDGPGAHTEEILDLLKKHNAKATFFVLGLPSKYNTTVPRENTLRRIVREGHQVGSHSWSHPRMSEINAHQQRQDMIRMEIAIRNTIGVYPTYMRAPYTDCSERSGCLGTMHGLGYHVVTFGHDSQDWNATGTFDIKKSIKGIDEYLNKVDAALIIMHDTRRPAVDLTKHILSLKMNGKRFTTLHECRADKAPWYRISKVGDELGKPPRDTGFGDSGASRVKIGWFF